MAREEIFELKIPEQGIRRTFKKAEAIKFFEAELAWAKQFSSKVGGQVAFQGNGIPTHELTNGFQNYLTELLNSVKAGSFDKVRSYADDASRMQLVVGQGSIGKALDQLGVTNQEEATWGLIMHSRKFASGSNFRIIAPLRGALLSNPSIKTGGVLDALVDSEERTASLERNMRERLAAYEEQIKKQSATIEELEVLFRKKLPMEEPASFWERVAQSKEKRWKVWLGLFSALTIAPIALIIFFWSLISPELAKLVSTGNSFSLTGLAAIGVPALLYGWLLKNVSRVFIQQMNLADDAAHRRALTITWLGMVAEKRFEMSEQERALALNAMFRAAPPHMLDDGPPAGLMELLGKK